MSLDCLIRATSVALMMLGGCAERQEGAAAAAAAAAVRQGEIPEGGDEDGLSVASPAVGEVADGVVIATWERAASASGVVGSALALAQGRLVLRDHCLLLTAPDGRTILPVFPSDRVRWDAPSRTLIHQGRNYRPGDQITIGGGGVRKDSPAMTRIAGLVDRCAPDMVFVVGG